MAGMRSTTLLVTSLLLGGAAGVGGALLTSRLQRGTAPPRPPAPPARPMKVLQEEAISRHRQAPRDATWAAPAEAAFRGDLGDLARREGFVTRALDCRRQSCAAELEWPSYEQAAAHYKPLLHHGYRYNCRRYVPLPPPADRALPYRTTVVFEC